MKMDFDKIVDRRNTGSCKWQAMPKNLADEGIIPFTVADMEIETPQPVKDALHAAAEHGICGYTEVDDAYFNALSGFMQRRHGFGITRECLLCTTGIVPAFGIVLRALTNEGDGIIVQPPVYPQFFHAVNSNDRKIIENPLLFDGEHYEIDFTGLEEACKSGAKMLLFCSPHNPVGRVWTKDELTHVYQICKKYNVIILCDEIHNDILFNDTKHTVFADIESAKDILITCMAMSKTFNLAGLMFSNLFVFNKQMRDKIENEMTKCGMHCISYFGRAAGIAAFNECDSWVDELVKYIDGNFNLCYDFISNNIPELKCIKAQGTYVLWLDCRELGLNDKQLTDFFMDEAKMPVNGGAMFGTGGEGFVRINIAVPKEELKKALMRLSNAVKNRR